MSRTDRVKDRLFGPRGNPPPAPPLGLVSVPSLWPIVSQTLPDPYADVVIHGLLVRAELGARKYGVALGSFNDRDALRDEIEEIIDAMAYAQCKFGEGSMFAWNRILGYARTAQAIIEEAEHEDDTVHGPLRVTFNDRGATWIVTPRPPVVLPGPVAEGRIRWTPHGNLRIYGDKFHPATWADRALRVRIGRTVREWARR